jgi:EmrB/QacA subfamily drug resistance transporter
MGETPTGRVSSPGPPAPVRRAGSNWHRDGPQPVRPRVIFFVVSLALLMSSIDQTIVATALPDIHRSLHASLTWTGWTITIYSLGRVLILPLAGGISDRYGRRTIFLASVGLFTVASLCCGLAANIYVLIALRAVQAVGGAAFMPSATGLVVDHFGSSRDRAVGLFTSIIPIGALLGPTLGGFFVEYWSWRGIFLINIPIGLALLYLGRRFIPAYERDAEQAFPRDLTGMALLAVGLLGAMLGLALLGSGGIPIISAQFLLPEVVAVVALCAFVRHSLHSPTSFIPAQLLYGDGFGVMNTINFLFGACALGFSALVPLYATQRYGMSALDSGTLLSARGIGMVSVSGLATFALRRTGYRWPMLIGFLLTAFGLFAMACAPRGLSPYAWLSLAAALTGLGMGVANPAAQNASLQLAPEHAAAISALRATFRQAGAILAVSVSTTILARSSDPGLAQARIFGTFAVILVVILPLLKRVPEHHGTW